MSKRKSAKHDIVDAEELKPLKDTYQEFPDASQPEAKQEEPKPLFPFFGYERQFNDRMVLYGLSGNKRKAMNQCLELARTELLDKLQQADRTPFLALAKEFEAASLAYRKATKAAYTQFDADIDSICEKYKVSRPRYIQPGEYSSQPNIFAVQFYFDLHEKAHQDLMKVRDKLLAGVSPAAPAKLPKELQQVVEQFKTRGLLQEGGSK